MVNGWTLERLARQSQIIHNWKPWEQSTGPKTRQGKGKVSRNAYKGGMRRMLRELARMLKEQDRELRQVAI